MKLMTYIILYERQNHPEVNDKPPKGFLAGNEKVRGNLFELQTFPEVVLFIIIKNNCVLHQNDQKHQPEGKCQKAVGAFL